MKVLPDGASGEVLIGVDVGGTFTDLVAVRGHKRTVRKTPSRPDQPGEDVIEGLRLVARDLDFKSPRDLLGHTALILHGSTVATNILLTRSGQPVGLIATQGFADVLEMRGGIRESIFDNHLPNALPLAPRHLRLEASEETDRGGHVLARVEPDEVRALTEELRRGGAGSIAIAFKHSHANPENERRAADAARGQWPDAYVTVSSELTARARLYDRVSSAVINSYVGPQTERYLLRLNDELVGLGFEGQLLVMAGNGGVITVRDAVRQPASLILSGPAAGPIAGRMLLSEIESEDGVIVDMGGTSFDVSLLRQGQIHVTHRSEVNRYRLALPMLEIHTIGAGGGSIARVDDIGLIQVGPESAGAVPGPACYGLGGTEPTVTDANVVLGLLPAGIRLGGVRTLDPALAQAAIRDRIARPLDCAVETAAWGIHSVASANMATAVREMTLGKGVDPRGLPLVVGGGAGALHATDIAETLGFDEVLVPWDAGVLCALGLVNTEVRHDRVLTLMHSVDQGLMRVLPDLIARMKRELGDRLDAVAHLLTDREYVFECGLRYGGQFHELPVSTSENDLLGGDPEPLIVRFGDAHERAYGFKLDQAPVEIVDLRVTAVGPLRRTDATATGSPHLAASGRRTIFTGDGWVEVSVLRATPTSGLDSFPGPAMVDLSTTSAMIAPGWEARAGSSGLLLSRTK